MMLPQDALLLAMTKLKTRRIRLIVTAFVAGLLFILLSALSMVMNGAINSIESFSGEGLGKRYLVQLNAVDQYGYSLGSEPEIIAQAKLLFDQVKKDKAAAAKKLGIQYDPLSEQSPIITEGPNGGEFVDPNSKIGVQIATERNLESSKSFYEAIKTVQNGYEVTGQHSSISLGLTYGPSTENSVVISPIKNGKEQSTDNNDGNNYMSRGVDSVVTGMVALDDKVLNAFALENQSFTITDGQIPIVAPYTAAEEILGLSPLAASSTVSETLDRLKAVRDDIAGSTFNVCLRNKESAERQQTASQQANEIATNKGKKGYRLPDVVYSISDNPCQDVTITRDVRTTEQKKLEAKQEEFDKLFGKQNPAQRLVTFRVVGITPDPPEFTSFQVTDILGGLLTSYLGSGWFIPLSSGPALPEYSSAFAKINTSTSYDVSNYLEFASASDARKFIKQESCDPQEIDFSGVPAGTEVLINSFDPYASCIADGKPFFTDSFGSSSIALDELRAGFTNFFSKAMLIVALISAFIMMGTVGKIIADSRRETAVFRAIGAKKLDIAQIYITYTMLIATIISIFSVGVGWLLASYVNGRYGDDFTIQALVSFNATDLTKRFTLVGFDVGQLGFLVLVVFAGSILASAIPLFTNLRRNPIKDMRDER